MTRSQVKFVYERKRNAVFFSRKFRALVQGRSARNTCYRDRLFSTAPAAICAERVNCEAGRSATLISRPRPETVDPHISVFIAFRELNTIARIQYCSALYYCGDSAGGALKPVASLPACRTTSRDPCGTLLRGVKSAFISARIGPCIMALYNL